MFVCASAVRLPTVMVSAASAAAIVRQSAAIGVSACENSRSASASAAAFDAVASQAAIGIGAPS